jgi:hypothetical protein
VRGRAFVRRRRRRGIERRQVAFDFAKTEVCILLEDEIVFVVEAPSRIGIAHAGLALL